jgi:N-glycosidase YbiA
MLDQTEGKPVVLIDPNFVTDERVQKIGGNRLERRALRGAVKRKKGRFGMSSRNKALKDTNAPVEIYERTGYCLSFFSAHTVDFQVAGQQIIFMTAEHAYQAAKFTDLNIIQEINYARSPLEAKQIAHRHRDKYRSDWTEKTKLCLYEAVARAKALQHSEVRVLLAKTRGRKIRESAPMDSFWGLGSDGSGRNHAGKIWMKVREDLLSEGG